ncbi:DUF4168 domain-containing protein [Olivibacter domesticus]|nr:DUF4168 domain-containing protein [Olivibacter domesticus]
MMRILKNNITVMIALLFAVSIGSKALAQENTGQQVPLKEDFKKEELQSFIKANQKVVELQKVSEEKMVKVIQEEGLTVERFNQLAASQQNPDKKVQAEPKEMETFNAAAQKITGIGKEADTQMQQSIKQEGIDVETYQQIILAYQKSPKVKQQLEALLPKK